MGGGGAAASTAASTAASSMGASWVNPAMFGLQALATVGAASNQAKQSRAQIRANNAAMGDITLQLGMTDEAAAAQKDVAQYDYKQAFKGSGLKTSTMFDDMMTKFDDSIGAQGFSYSGGVERTNNLMQDRLQSQFTQGKDTMLDSLDKSLASITEWQDSEKFRLGVDKRSLEAQNRVLKKTNSTWKALGF
jgi:hypothetical protein